MTEYIVPMGTSEFFHGFTPVIGAGRTWVGAYPYIDTADTDTSYGEINTAITGESVLWDGSTLGHLGAMIPAYTAPAGVTDARVDLQIYTPDVSGGAFHGGVWGMHCDDVTSPWDWVGYGPTPSSPIAGWNTWADVPFNNSWGPGSDLPSLLASLATGSMRFSAFQNQAGATFRVSLLRLTLIGAGIPPLRQVQRNDGLGRSTWRGRGVSSVQRSVRQRGYR